MAIDSNVLQEVVDALKQDPEIKNNVYQATVSRIDSEGVVWVNIAGSDTETPTAITSAEVAPGDAVNVEWRNNKLYIGGNYSNPSAGVVRVANVEQIADVAVAQAARAQTAAVNAETYAQDAKATAEAVHGIAEQAAQDASDAKTAAGTAQTAADSALVGLSTVEDVVGVLNWITAHGTMTSQSGGTFDPDQVYFVMDDSTPGDYHVGSHYYSIVSEPKAADINSYYVLTVDESVQNYVATHIVVDSEGLWIIPDAGGNKVLIATGSGSTYTTAGTYIVGKVGGVDTVLAEFTASGARVGQSNDAHLDLDYNSMQFADKENNTFFYVSDLRTWQTIDGQDVLLANISESMVSTSETPITTVNPSFLPYSVGTTTAKVNGVDVPVAAVGNAYGVLYIRLQSTFNYGDLIEVTYKTASNFTKAYTVGKRKASTNIGAYSVAEGYDATASGHYSHTEGNNTTASGYTSHAEGGFTTASGDTAHAEGSGTTASGSVSHAEGANTIASGTCSHAEGNFTTASGVYSHAEGEHTEASGGYSHAEGQYTTASDYYSHAQGHSTTASGVYSHAEGSSTTASGLASHAQNEGTKASKKAQTVVGTYNIEDISATTTHPSGDTDYGKYAVIVGNGTSTRSNALTVDWSGNVEAAGDVTDGAGTSISDLAIDYIIEEGTTGDWHYRKWHSGRRECWTSLYYANTAMTSAEGSGYYAAQKTITFPTNFFSGNFDNMFFGIYIQITDFIFL